MISEPNLTSDKASSSTHSDLDSQPPTMTMLLVIVIGLFAITAQGLPTPAGSCQRVTYNFTLNKEVFHATRWRNPSAQPTNIVFLSHGYGEYIDFTYHQLANVLCHQGSLVLSHDHVGHGRSRCGHQLNFSVSFCNHGDL